MAINHNNPKFEKLKGLQAIDMTIIDLSEYLDTHANDSFAIERYNLACADYQKAKAEYEDLYGPLSLDSLSSTNDKWLWALDDFPWDL